jgi:hypothetical protein
VLQPKRLHGLAGNNVVPVVEARAAELLKRPLLTASIVGDHAGGLVSLAVFFPVIDVSTPWVRSRGPVRFGFDPIRKIAKSSSKRYP